MDHERRSCSVIDRLEQSDAIVIFVEADRDAAIPTIRSFEAEDVNEQIGKSGFRVIDTGSENTKFNNRTSFAPLQS